jgi:hypothetical protein
MSDLDFPQLRQTLNRGFDFGMNEISKSGLELASGGDLALALMKLQEWQAAGYIQIVSNPFNSASDEICVRILMRIEDGDSWSDPMSGKM